MNRIGIVVIAFAALGMMTACGGPTPEKVCQHMMDLAQGEAEEGAEEPTDEEIEEAMESCVESYTERAEDCGDNANAAMQCMLDADSLEAAMECSSHCEEDEEE